MNPLPSLLSRLFTRSDIGRDTPLGTDTYLRRWSLFCDRFAPGHHLFLHQFLRSDHDTYHDHPWPFTSLIFSGGYWEHTLPNRRTWYPPGSILRRPAHHAHWIEIPSPGKTWSLVWTGAKIRHWGFRCPQGWLPWRAFQHNLDRNLPGCG